jgi:competence protein ComEC
MSAMFLLAIVLDRTAISMPPVAWAAVAVLLISPEELVGPSFQMSFAAVIALVAAYEATQARRLRWRSESGWRGRAGLYLGGLVFTSLIASLATAPYAIYHFNRLAAYGVSANMLAVPLTGLWVMPWAVATLLLMPFGAEQLALTPMGWGIDTIIDIAHVVADWPGAVSLVPVMPMAGLVIATLGGLWLCLWRRPWRLLGVPAIPLGLAMVLLGHTPDVLVADDGRLFAVRDPDGGLLLSSSRADRFEADIWLRRSATEAALAWPKDGYGAGGRLACDGLGCIYSAFGKSVALVQQPGALPEDCQVADVVVSVEPVRIPCLHPGTVIDRFDLWRNGAYAIWINDDGGIDIQSARQTRGERPWVVAPPD